MDVESKASVFNKMYECGRTMCKRYPPSQKFTDNLSKILEKWKEFVGLTSKLLNCFQLHLLLNVSGYYVTMELLESGHSEIRLPL